MSQLQVNRINDASGGVLAPISSVMRNRIINGAMVISQRNGTSSVTPGPWSYALDRWQFELAQSSKLTVQQNAGSVAAPPGFSNYMGIVSTSAYTVGSGESFNVRQYIEGFNFADMAWGTANARTVTLSFWIRSSLTGTFGGALKNAAGNRSYPFGYTVSAANTWEYKTITVAGDTTGTWVGATNGIGLVLAFGLGVGTTFSGTAGSWQSGNLNSSTGATSVVGTNGATFYITGVQLEVGTQATSFEYRQYQQELALCQRYYELFNTSSSGIWATVRYAVVKRALPLVIRTGIWNSGSETGTVVAISETAQVLLLNSGSVIVGGTFTSSAELSV